MSAYYAPESSAIFYSQMARAVSMFSGGSATTARWMDGSCESPYPGSPPVAKRCARLEAEVVQLRKRLNTEMRLLPIVQSTDAGGLTCEFMFPADKAPRRSSAIAPRTLEPLPVSHSERDVVEAGGRACTETPRNVDSGRVEAAWVTIFDADVEDAKAFASPSVDVVFQQGGAPLGDLLPSPVVQDGVEQDEYDFPVLDNIGNAMGREQHEVVERATGASGGENKDEGTKSIPDDVTDHATDEIECVGVHSMTPSSSTPVFALSCQQSQTNHGSFLNDVTIILRQAGCEEELPSSIGTLIKWSHDTPPATSSVAGGYSDVSASLTTRGVRSRWNRSALEVPRLVLTDVFNLGISGAYRSTMYSPVTSGSLPCLFKFAAAAPWCLAMVHFLHNTHNSLRRSPLDDERHPQLPPLRRFALVSALDSGCLSASLSVDSLGLDNQLFPRDNDLDTWSPSPPCYYFSHSPSFLLGPTRTLITGAPLASGAPLQSLRRSSPTAPHLNSPRVVYARVVVDSDQVYPDPRTLDTPAVSAAAALSTPFANSSPNSRMRARLIRARVHGDLGRFLIISELSGFGVRSGWGFVAASTHCPSF
ncbi:hypothetical protein C2E23DRAFT_860461 [Lenzites betulinus]|nr:hypothetical protein C2E23DRAFT_860461 [Lenzites betulinus]